MRFDEMNYQADGTVLASCALDQWCDDDQLFLVLVDTGSDPMPFCVARYQDGAQERCSGRYFGEISKARTYFAKQIILRDK